MVRGLHVPILSECAESMSVLSASTLPSIFITFIWKNRKCLTSCQLFTFYFCPIWEFSYYCFGITITGSMNEKNWFYSLLTSEIISIVKQFYFHFLNCSSFGAWERFVLVSLSDVPCDISMLVRCSDTLDSGQWRQAGADMIETLTAPSWHSLCNVAR